MLVLCAIALVVTSVFATLAYMTSTKSITNTFTVGDVEITLVETKVNSLGQPVDAQDKVVGTEGAGEAVTTNSGNEYKLLPGRTYTKDPTIALTADSENAWFICKIDNGLGENITLSDLGTGWSAIDGKAGYYAYQSVVAYGDEVPAVFSSFTLKPTLDSDAIAALKSEEIVITAYAVQADGIENIAAAYDALVADGIIAA